MVAKMDTDYTIELNVMSVIRKTLCFLHNILRKQLKDI